ncbi:MAG: CDP-diacylglycerol--serine O-phosphatidyltransferase [Myxococcales bacterium]|nr:CDP-diacylglycerol--serine O-phosphatidyltransferase [Myxococcales bacterium]
MKKVDLRRSLFILPNLFTLSSVLCGFYAVLVCGGPGATDDDYYRAALLIVFAMFFDTIDGRVARLTKTQSAIGVQLDSLADVISFGVATGVLVYRWSLHKLGAAGVAIAFAYVACGTIRLARFNVLAVEETGAPKAPGKYILGLPIPAASGILISLVVANTATETRLLGTTVLIAGVVVLLSFFMVSTVRFRSFKDLKLSARTVLSVSLAVGSTAFLALRYHASIALVWLLASYVLIGIVETVIGMVRREPAGGAVVEDDAELDDGEYDDDELDPDAVDEPNTL